MNRLRKVPGAMIPHSADDRALEGRMNLPTTIQFDGMPLRKALDDLRQIHGLNIYVDEQALLERGIGLDRPVTIKLDQIALKTALNLMLRNLGLTYIIEDGTVQITTPDKTRGKMTLATHYVADLVIPICNYGQPAGRRPRPAHAAAAGSEHHPAAADHVRPADAHDAALLPGRRHADRQRRRRRHPGVRRGRRQ